jgi:hypothetical protein
MEPQETDAEAAAKKNAVLQRIVTAQEGFIKELEVAPASRVARGAAGAAFAA